MQVGVSTYKNACMCAEFENMIMFKKTFLEYVFLVCAHLYKKDEILKAILTTLNTNA